MVIKAAANQQNWGGNQGRFMNGGGCSSVPGGGAAAAGGGKSMSTSGSVGSSPSSKTLNRLHHLDIQAAAADDDAGSPGAVSGKKKKRAQPGGGGGNKAGGGRGLRQFSIKVCEKVEAKGRTTYNEVADELVAEFSTQTPDNPQNFEEKNIRRRVYDALNVLMAMDIISKEENKEIIWRGLPRPGTGDELKAQRVGLRNRIASKAAHLQELEEQFAGLQNLIQRNEQLCCSGDAAATKGGVPLPFILVQTRPHATVEVEISEDMQLVHFDFNNTPFELHDDSFVLKSMGFCDNSPTKNEIICTQESASNRGEGSNIGTSQTPQEYAAALEDGGDLLSDLLELDEYLSESYICSLNQSSDILKYWKDEEQRFPVLSRMAGDVLPIPILTVTSESALSIGGRVIDQFHNFSLPENAETLITNRDWIYGVRKEDFDEDDGVIKEDVLGFEALNINDGEVGDGEIHIE